MNSEHYFDQLTKLMAGSLPRRDALRRFGAVVAGAVFGPLGFNREASADLRKDCQNFCKVFKAKKDLDACLKLCEKVCPSPKLLCCSGNKIKTLVCCTNGVCTNGVCKPPTCSDHVKNGTETDVDCGGSNCPKCGNGKHCNGSGDCQSGICTGGVCQSANLCAGVACPAPDQCELPSQCDPATGACSRSFKPNGTPCNDGNACTQTDTCQNGVCVGSNPVVCTAIDQCHDAGMYNPATGQCSNPPKADGTACNDGNACTQTDTCQSGVCVGSNPVICTASDQCHNAGTCDPSTGACSNPEKPDATKCDDGNACTENDHCMAGVCIGTPVNCDDGNFCTTDTCDPQLGCVHTPLPNGTACSDGNACTQTDTCQAGTCVGSNPVICSPVTNSIGGVCNPATGQCNYTCAAGFANCDGTFANGCETNTQFSNSHCGGCGIACPLGTSCSSGVCES